MKGTTMSDAEDREEEDQWDRESKNLDRIAALFEKFDDDYIKFERIPPEQRRHPRPDICALIYLHERFGGPVDEDGTSRDAICAADHHEVRLDWKAQKLFDFTEEDALYLARCGVRYDSSSSTFAMFV